MKTRKKYHDLYLKFDVLLLADVFEKFRYSSLKNDALRLSNYLITTALGWDAMLSMTKVEFEVVSDADICLFFEKGMRDGVSYVSKKSSKVNNKDL